MLETPITISLKDIQEFTKIKNGGNALLVYCYLLNYRFDGHEVTLSLEDIMLNMGWNPTKFRNSIKILKENDFIKTQMIKDSDGKFKRSETFIMR